MRAVTITLTLMLNVALAQTPFDQPLVTTTRDAQVVLGAVASAQDTVFIVMPQLEARLSRIVEQVGRSLRVYIIIDEQHKDNAVRNLRGERVNVRTLPRLTETLILIDYRTLVHGNVFAGDEAQLVDTSSFELVMVNQLRAAWQAADPY